MRKANIVTEHMVEFILIIIAIVLGALLIIGIATNIEDIGQTISNILGGVF